MGGRSNIKALEGRQLSQTIFVDGCDHQDFQYHKHRHHHDRHNIIKTTEIICEGIWCESESYPSGSVYGSDIGVGASSDPTKYTKEKETNFSVFQ